MARLTLLRDARILVCDGRTALFLKNTGIPAREAFEVEQTMRQELPAHTADMGADKPGRVGQTLSGPKSSIEGVDWHARQEDAFVKEAILAFARLCARSAKGEVVIVAPPRAMATIRAAADDKLLARCVAEISKDLTKHPVQEIQRIVLG